MDIKKYEKLADKIGIILNVLLCLTIYVISKGSIILLLIGYLVTAKLFDKYAMKLFTKWAIRHSKIDVKNIDPYIYSCSRKAFEKSIYEELKDEKLKLAKLQKQKEEQEQKEMEIINHIKNKDTDRLNALYTDILKFCDQYKKEHEFYDDIKHIKLLVAEIKKKTTENANNVKLIPKNIYIYTREFINLISSYENLNKENQKKYRTLYSEMMDELIQYLATINEKLTKTKTNDQKIDLITLIQELKEENKKES